MSSQRVPSDPVDGASPAGRKGTGIRVAVVGSANLDVVMHVPRFVEPGETLLGQTLEEMPGGKGLNQAVAAARRTRSALVACIGDDDAGELLQRHLASAGLDLGHTRRGSGQTGKAFIQVTSDGENSIVVMPLRNNDLSPDDVVNALEALDPAVIVAQLEVPMGAVVAAADWARAHDVRFVLNPSTMQPLESDLLQACDPLVVNAVEARALVGDPGTSAVESRSLPTLACQLAALARSVVVTDGGNGAYLADAGAVAVHVPARPVAALDTTGAGDEFTGALAAELSAGRSLLEAVQEANAAAAAVVVLPRAERVIAAHPKA
jgi:ribokinase